MSREPRYTKVANLRSANRTAAWTANERLRAEALTPATGEYTKRTGREVSQDTLAILRYSWNPLEPTAGVDMDQSIRHDDPLGFELIRSDELRDKVNEVATEETAAAMTSGWHAADILSDIIEDLVARPDDALYKEGDQWV